MASAEDVNVSSYVARSLENVRFLAEMCNFDIIQVNGQRIFGPPKVWKGPPPGKGCEIFVGNLPRYVYEDELVPMFWQAGTIYQMRLMMEHSGANRGFCFIQFCDRISALQAINMFRDFYIRPSCKLHIAESKDNCRLFVGGIPPFVTQHQLEEILNDIWEGIVEIILYPCHTDKRLNRGFAFVEFEDHRAAAIARRNGHHEKLVISGIPVKVDWAKTEEVDEDVVNQVKVLYLRNLPLNITEMELKIALMQRAPGLSFQKVKIIKDFAFVHFSTRNDAEVGFSCWNKMELNGSTIEVKWARPPPAKTLKSSFSSYSDVALHQIPEQNAFPMLWNTSRMPANYGCRAATSGLPPTTDNVSGYYFADGALWRMPQMQSGIECQNTHAQRHVSPNWSEECEMSSGQAALI